jgi:toxin YoeB
MRGHVGDTSLGVACLDGDELGIAALHHTPRTGTGKPERLKHLGGEVWSRRITEKDRLVYDIQTDVVTIIACRFHYDDH